MCTALSLPFQEHCCYSSKALNHDNYFLISPMSYSVHLKCIHVILKIKIVLVLGNQDIIFVCLNFLPFDPLHTFLPHPTLSSLHLAATNLFPVCELFKKYSTYKKNHTVICLSLSDSFNLA